MKTLTSSLTVLLFSILVNATTFYEISYDESSQVVKYLVHKDELPYCHKLSLFCHFIDFHKENSGFHRRRDHRGCNQKNMASFSSTSYKNGAYDYSWDYTGELHAPIVWRQAIVEFSCYEKGRSKPIQTIEKKIVKRLSEPALAKIFKDEDEVGFTVQVRELDWEFIEVKCSSPKTKFKTKFYCYPDSVTGNKGSYDVHCGSYLLFGIGDYYCTYSTWAFGESSKPNSQVQADVMEIKKPKAVEVVNIEAIGSNENVTSDITVVVSLRVLSNSFQTRLYINCTGDAGDTEENLVYNQHVFEITNLVYQPPNLALYKPTHQSSTSDSAHNSNLAVNGIHDDPDDFSLAIDEGIQWWRVNLQRLYEIGTVKIYNGNDYLEKLAKMTIHTSVNNTLYTSADWTKQYTQKVPVGSQLVVVDFDQIVEAQMVELRSENHGSLCLREVTVHAPVNLKFKWSFKGERQSSYTFSVTAISKPQHFSGISSEDDQVEESDPSLYSFYT